MSYIWTNMKELCNPFKSQYNSFCILQSTKFDRNDFWTIVKSQALTFNLPFWVKITKKFYMISPHKAHHSQKPKMHQRQLSIFNKCSMFIHHIFSWKMTDIQFPDELCWIFTWKMLRIFLSSSLNNSFLLYPPHMFQCISYETPVSRYFTFSWSCYSSAWLVDGKVFNLKRFLCSQNFYKSTHLVHSSLNQK